MPSSTKPDSASEQLRKEIWKTIDRYGSESDLTICEALGVLELVKAGLLENFRTRNHEGDDAT